MPNRYNSPVTVEVRGNNQPSPTKYFGDLQQAYIWIQEFISTRNPGAWNNIEDFVRFADILDDDIYLRGVRYGCILISSGDSYIMTYYT